MSKLSALLLASLAGICFSTAAVSKEYTKHEIETIVHDYLIEHPEVLMEAAEKLHKKQLEQAKNAEKTYLETYKEEIFNSPHDGSVGPKDARNVIVEFSDYNCGYCKRVKKLFFNVINKHKDKNDLRFVFKEFPILGPGSEAAAKTSLAVAKTYPDSFLDFHMAIINQQSKLASFDDIKPIAEKLGFDWEKLLVLAQSKEIASVIEQNINLGMAMEITGTPCYIINGKFLRGAPQSESYIESLLK